MSNKKRVLSDLSESETNASVEAPISEEPPLKRPKLDEHAAARQHPHYQKFAKALSNISAFTSVDFRNIVVDNSDDDDCVIIDSSVDLFACSDCNEKDLQIRKTEKQIAELKQKIIILKRLTTPQCEPKYNQISVDKFNGITTRAIGIIKNKLMSKYDKKRIYVEMKNAGHKKYQKAIILFLKKNKNSINQTNYSNSHQTSIVVSEQQNNHNNNNKKKIKRNFQKQADLFTLRDDNGEFDGDIQCNMSKTELVSKYGIMENSVIGEYHGLQMTQQEFEDIYHLSQKKELARMFAFDEWIDKKQLDELDEINNVLISDDDDDDNDGYAQENEDGDNQLNAVLDDVRKHDDDGRQGDGKFVIDAIGFQSYHSGENHLLMYVKPVDDSESNVEFVTAVVNGWPRIFCVSKKMIQRNEVICANFKRKYEVAKFESQRENLRKARLELVVDSILKMPLFLEH